MDLFPKPDQVLAAASTVLRRAISGSVADLRPMPRSLIDAGRLRQLYRYQPAPGAAAHGDPVLLVAPLAAPARCYDLRRGCSLVEHLLAQGHPTYLLEYGEVSFHDHDLDLRPWVEEVLPAAIRAVVADAGSAGVHLAGWSLGGIIALLAAADQPALPLDSVSVLRTPVDLTHVPLVAPVRPLVELPSAWTTLTGVIETWTPGGGLLSWARELSAYERWVMKPLAVASHLDDADYLAQLEAVARFSAEMTAYPGRTFGQVYHRFLGGTEIARGALTLGERTLALRDVVAPVLVVAGASDQIAPVSAVHPLEQHLSGATEVQVEVVPGGHLGQVTGRAAARHSWPVLTEWFDRWSAPSPAGTR